MTAQILSRARLSRIIDELDLYKEESKSHLREEIIGMMRERIRVAPVFSELETDLPQGRRDLSINTFRIGFRHKDARTAMLVAQRLANDFIEQHISSRVKLSQKSLEFIQTELDRLSDADPRGRGAGGAGEGRESGADARRRSGPTSCRLDRIVASLHGRAPPARRGGERRGVLSQPERERGVDVGAQRRGQPRPAPPATSSSRSASTSRAASPRSTPT